MGSKDNLCPIKAAGAHLHLVRRLRMGGAVPLVPLTFSWYGASLSTGTTLPFIYVDIKYKLIRVKYGIL